MPTYALLGATGSTGSAILRCLLLDAPARLKLNILVRSKSKLLMSFPHLQESTLFPVNIIEGTGTDQAALQACVDDSEVIFMCVGTNDSSKATSVAYDTASTMISSLEALRKEHGNRYRAPTILQLRTISLNPNLGGHSSASAPSILNFCLYHVYSDLERASALYDSAARETPGLFDYIFVDPPALHDANGTKRTGHKLLTPEEQRTEPHSGSLSYADLGAAFCELAERRAEFLGQSAGVTATGKLRTTWGTLVGYILRGARGRIFG